ncbi:hypothetical protein L484_026319 [Morus notabilis]|uniref:Uncharacterized protein n=1 Tax=Morus notabilis TaxID=981085 RepID=W9QXT1_9ROSA|nr:hypothetical protein L484_026319 [Morus notabilis]
MGGKYLKELVGPGSSCPPRPHLAPPLIARSTNDDDNLSLQVAKIADFLGFEKIFLNIERKRLD